MKVLTTFEIPIIVDLNDNQLREGRKLINQHYVQDDHANKWSEYGYFVSKYPEYEKNHPEFKEAHYRLYRGKVFKFQFNLMEDGSLQKV